MIKSDTKWYDNILLVNGDQKEPYIYLTVHHYTVSWWSNCSYLLFPDITDDVSDSIMICKITCRPTWIAHVWSSLNQIEITNINKQIHAYVYLFKYTFSYPHTLSLACLHFRQIINTFYCLAVYVLGQPWYP